MRSARLTEAGVLTLKALAQADPETLASLPGFSQSVALKAIAHAQSLLGSLPEAISKVPTLSEVDPVAVVDNEEPATPNKKAMKRGLDAARRLEDTRSWVARARHHAKRIKSKPRRRGVRAALRKLSNALEKAQEEVLQHGLTKGAAADLTDLLCALERSLRKVTDRKKVNKKRATALRKTSRTARRALKKRMS